MSVVKGDAVGEYMLTTKPGTQDISVMMYSDPYDFSGAYYRDTSSTGMGGSNNLVLAGVVVINTTKVARLNLTFTSYDGEVSFPMDAEVSKDISITEPNGTYSGGSGLINARGVGNVTLTAYDADGNVLQTAEIPENATSGGGVM